MESEPATIPKEKSKFGLCARLMTSTQHERTPLVLQIAFVAISTLSLTCMYVKAWIRQYKGPPAAILRHHPYSRHKNKFVSVVNLEELAFDVFDRTKVTFFRS